jgi:hypothetical protein
MEFLKNNYLFILLLCLILSCDTRDKKKEKNIHTEQQSKDDNPKVDIKVNKNYDDKGNLIRLDSTYSYFYSPKGLDSSKVSLDTAVQRFRSIYNTKVTDLMDKRFKELFLNDSLFQYDFLNKDYFSKRVELNRRLMNNLFLEMDSLKNNFMNEPKKQKNNLKK